MKSNWQKMKETLVALHRDEQGAEGFEKILLIGAIVLPLLGILIFFRQEITEWLSDLWGDVRGDTDDYQSDGDPF